MPGGAGNQQSAEEASGSGIPHRKTSTACHNLEKMLRLRLPRRDEDRRVEPALNAPALLGLPEAGVSVLSDWWYQQTWDTWGHREDAFSKTEGQKYLPYLRQTLEGARGYMLLRNQQSPPLG